MKENERISALKGIGEKTEKLFQKLDVYTVGDLIRYFPHGYDVYEPLVPISEVEENHVMTVSGAIYGRVSVGGSPKHDVICEGFDRNLEGCLVSDAFFKKHVGRRGANHPPGQGRAQEGRPFDGASGNFLPAREIPGKTRFPAAGLFPG